MQYSKLDELITKFLRYQEDVGHRPATIIVYQKEFSKDLRYFQDKEFDYPTLRSYFDQRIAEGRKPSSINQDVKRYKAFLNWAANEDEIEPKENFSKKLHTKKIERDEKIPSWELANKIVHYLEHDRPRSPFSKIPEELIQGEYIPALKLMMYSGVRSGAFEHLKGNDIRATDSSPVMSIENKGGAIKEVHIPPQCLEDMRKRETRGSDFAFEFLSRDRNAYQQKFSDLVKQGAKAVGANPEDIRPHKFRHTYITHIVNESGVQIQDAKELVGHSKIETTMHYFHPDKNHLAEVVRNSIGRENPELLKPGQYRDSIIAGIERLGIERWRINCEGQKLVVSLEGI